MFPPLRILLQQTTTISTCGWRFRNAFPTAASCSRTAWKGSPTSTCGSPCGTPGRDTNNPSASSRTMCRSARPSSCDWSSASESNRRMSASRLLVSFCNCHLQYISTRGRSCMQVTRIACGEGEVLLPCWRHTSWPARREAMPSPQ